MKQIGEALQMPEEVPWRNEWEIIRQNIGEGGQGTTHLVRRKSTGEHGVLKELKDARNSQARKRMRFEVDALKLLSDKGAVVPRVVDTNVDKAEEIDSLLYFVMEWIDGQTLDEFVSQHNGLSLEESLLVVTQIAATIAIGHAEGLGHRDLKPKNLMVRRKEDDSVEIVILDYGLSFNRTSKGGTRKSENIWNEFLSLPELNIAGGQRRDLRVDITQMCGLLFYCLTGRSPQMLRDDEERPPHKRPGVVFKDVTDESDQALLLDSFFSRGFRQRANDRFQSIDEFSSGVSAIKSCIEGDGISLSAVAQRESQILRSHDRVTQLELVKPRLEGLYGSLVGAIGRAYKGHDLDLFKVSKRTVDLHATMESAPVNLEVLHADGRVWGAMIPPHSQLREICYGLGVASGDLVILRFLRNQNPGKLSDPSVLVSYPIDETPDFGEVAYDFKIWLRNSMFELRREVLPALSAESSAR